MSCVILSPLLSNPDAYAFLHFAENSQDGGIHADLIYDRPYDYSSAPEIVTVDRNAKYEFSTLERGVPQGYPLREHQEDKMQYLQVYFLLISFISFTIELFLNDTVHGEMALWAFTFCDAIAPRYATDYFFVFLFFT